VLEEPRRAVDRGTFDLMSGEWSDPAGPRDPYPWNGRPRPKHRKDRPAEELFPFGVEVEDLDKAEEIRAARVALLATYRDRVGSSTAYYPKSGPTQTGTSAAERREINAYLARVAKPCAT
jgi:hypothetical protein